MESAVSLSIRFHTDKENKNLGTYPVVLITYGKPEIMYRRTMLTDKRWKLPQD